MTVNPIQVQKFLSGLDYPASRDELIATAEREGADDAVLQTLRHLSPDRFDSPTAVSSAIGKEG